MYLQNGILQHNFGGTPFPQPTDWWLQLHYGDPGVYCTGSAWTWAGAYRKQCTSWTIGATSASNAVAVEWINVPDPVNPTITHVSVWTLVSGGNPLFYTELSTPHVVSAGNLLRFRAGTLVFNNLLPTDLGDVTGTVTVSWASSSIVRMRLTGDVSLAGGFTSPSGPKWLALMITQDGTGGRTVTWPTALKGSPPLVDPVPGETTIVQLFYDGTYYHVAD